MEKEGTPKYIWASHSRLLATCNKQCQSPKVKRQPLGGCTFTVHVKAIAC